MAKVVLGFASSHGGMLSVPLAEWSRWEEQDKHDRRFDYAALLAQAGSSLEAEVAPEKRAERYAALQQAKARSRSLLGSVQADAYLVISNPHGTTRVNQPAATFGVYLSDSASRLARTGNIAAAKSGVLPPEPVADGSPVDNPDDYVTDPDLADHLAGSLIEDGFDLSITHQSAPSAGIEGHEFTNVYGMFGLDRRIPMVPFMLSRYRPHQATPARCFALGQAIRRAIESWRAEARVVLLASGGLSHQVLDVELDRQVLDALRTPDAEVLCSLPIDRLNRAPGTAESLNWVTVAGAMDPLPMTLIDYVPCYRSRAGTGLAATFGYWQ